MVFANSKKERKKTARKTLKNPSAFFSLFLTHLIDRATDSFSAASVVAAASAATASIICNTATTKPTQGEATASTTVKRIRASASKSVAQASKHEEATTSERARNCGGRALKATETKISRDEIGAGRAPVCARVALT